MHARTVTTFRFGALLVRLKEADVGFVVFLAIADGMMKDLFHSEAWKRLFVKKSGPFAENVAMRKSVSAVVTSYTFPFMARPSYGYSREGKNRASVCLTPDIDTGVF